jgi:hypothetical protein
MGTKSKFEVNVNAFLAEHFPVSVPAPAPVLMMINAK